MQFFTFANGILSDGMQFRRCMLGIQQRLPRYRIVIGTPRTSRQPPTIIELDATEGMVEIDECVTLMNGSICIGEPLGKSARVLVSRRNHQSTDDKKIFVIVQAHTNYHWYLMRGVAELFVPAPLAYHMYDGEYCGFRDGGALIMNPGDAIATMLDAATESQGSICAYDTVIGPCTMPWSLHWEENIRLLRSPR